MTLITTAAITISSAINTNSRSFYQSSGASGVTLSADIITAGGAITFNDAVTLGADVTLTAGTVDDVTLTGAVSIGTNNLTVVSSGTTTITGGITGSTGNVDITATTLVNIDGGIALTGAGTVRPPARPRSAA